MTRQIKETRFLDPNIYKKFNKTIEESFGMSFNVLNDKHEDHSKQFIFTPTSKIHGGKSNHDHQTKCPVSSMPINEKMKIAKTQFKLFNEKKEPTKPAKVQRN